MKKINKSIISTKHINTNERNHRTIMSQKMIRTYDIHERASAVMDRIGSEDEMHLIYTRRNGVQVYVHIVRVYRRAAYARVGVLHACVYCTYKRNSYMRLRTS